MRSLLRALLALALVVRIGAAREAMAATPSAPAAHQAHCSQMPVKPDKPGKSVVAACALCIALPGATAGRIATLPPVTLDPIVRFVATLSGLAGGPAPPPPKIA